MSGSIRDFYERYFLEQDFSPAEKLKQFEKIRALEAFVKSSGLGGFGIVVGVGKGAELSVMPESAVALDLPFAYLPLVKKNFPRAVVLQGDGTALPFASGVFDWVLCSEVLEHVPDRRAMLSEFARVLKVSGDLVLTTPNPVSLYGLARFAAELFTNRTLRAGYQPVDIWKSPCAMKKELSPFFRAVKMRGWWYFPPIGRGKMQLAPGFFALLFRLFMPVERLLRTAMPSFGHSIFILAKPAFSTDRLESRHTGFVS